MFDKTAQLSSLGGAVRFDVRVGALCLHMPPWLCFKCLFTLPVSCVMFQKSVTKIHAYGRFPKFHRVFGPRSWHIEIRHRVNKTSTISLFGFETLKLKIRRLKLWKPRLTSAPPPGIRCACRHPSSPLSLCRQFRGPPLGHVGFVWGWKPIVV